MKEQKDVGFACMVGVTDLFCILFYRPLGKAFALWMMWGWFAVPHGLLQLSYFQIMGICLLINTLITGYNQCVEAEYRNTKAERIARWLSWPTTLLIAFIIKILIKG